MGDGGTGRMDVFLIQNTPYSLLLTLPSPFSHLPPPLYLNMLVFSYDKE